jgi:tetratricopeptide (TPR) repeat protein
MVLAVLLTVAATATFPAPPQSRAEALAGLENPDTATRAEAVVWVANHGTMADAPLLHARLRDESSFVRDFAERGLWLLWTRSGDREIDTLMARASEDMQSGRYAEAIATLTQVIRKKPDYAEGWNRRATVYFLGGEHQKSIADCDEVLKRNPRHFGALSGLGQIYLQLGDPEKALAWFRRALEVNPNMLGVEMMIRQLEGERKARPAPGRST